MSSSRALLAGVLAVFTFALCAIHASARVDADSDYTKAQTYNGALRYLRVDLGYEVTEKDPDAAYILFKYQKAGNRKQESHGSLEVIEAKKRVRVFVQLPEMPGYHETMLRDGLLKKLRADYGEPPRKAPKEPPAPSKDAGAD
ncbi:MAG TPA: hypothetical protein PKD61_24545 [Polyangiaceae bacterium]|nr:hypothetical protein [Polyangiaceae bacterium]